MNPGFIFFYVRGFDRDGRERQGGGKYSTFGYYLLQPAFHLALSQECLQSIRVIAQRIRFLFKLNRERDDIPRESAVRGYPCGDRGQVFGFLVQVVFHCEVNGVDCWFCCYEGHLFIQGTD